MPDRRLRNEPGLRALGLVPGHALLLLAAAAALALADAVRQGDGVPLFLVGAAGYVVLLVRDRAISLARTARLATRDPLTGLANRRLFDETLPRELARAARRGQPVALVALDVDEFKHVNDEHGHPVGDAILRRIGQALACRVKASDLAARVGGDEFLVILPDCSLGAATRVAERLRMAASTDSPLPVTLSAGVAAAPQDGWNPAELLGAADAALYAAKAGGRARTVPSAGLRVTP